MEITENTLKLLTKIAKMTNKNIDEVVEQYKKQAIKMNLTNQPTTNSNV